MLISMPTGTSTIFGAFQAILFPRSCEMGFTRLMALTEFREKAFSSQDFGSAASPARQRYFRTTDGLRLPDQRSRQRCDAPFGILSDAADDLGCWPDLMHQIDGLADNDGGYIGVARCGCLFVALSLCR